MMTHRPRRPRYEDDYEYDDRPRRKEKSGMFSGITNQLDRIPLDWLLGIGSVSVVASACIGHSVTNYIAAVLWMGFCGAFLILRDKSIDSRDASINRFVKKYGKLGILSVTFGVLALTTLSFVIAEPSHAIFMSRAEEYAIGVFGNRAGVAAGAGASTAASITPIIRLIFGSLRIMIIIALAVGIYKIIAARDDSEDMKAQARLPIIIVISIAAFDIMSAMLIPATGINP